MTSRHITFIMLLLVAGCATTEIDDSAQGMTAVLLTTTLALAADDDAKDKRREHQPGEWTYCDIGCEFRRDLDRADARSAAKRLGRRQESERVQADFLAFTKELRTAE